MRNSTIRALGALLIIVSIVLAGSAATAQTKTWHDAEGDTNNNGLLDISTVKVKNTSKLVRASFRIPSNEFYPGPGGYFEILFDTKPDVKGPELSWSAWIPGEHSIVPVRKGKYLYKKEWLPHTTHATKCGKTANMRYDYEAGVVKIVIKKKTGCLGKPAKVRIRVKTVVTGEYDKDTNFVEYAKAERDYYPSKSTYSAWVKRS